MNNNQDSKEAFLKKIAICSQVLDFNDENKNVDIKRQRLDILQELQDIIANQQQMANLIMPNLEQVMSMFKKNLFRPLPIVKK